MRRTNIYISIIVFISIWSFSSFFSINRVYAFTCPTKYSAGCQGGCEYVGQCINNVTCTEQAYYGYLVLATSSEACGSALIGGVAPPEGVAEFNRKVILDAGGTGSIGVFYFITKILRFFYIISGLLIFGNFLYSAYIYIVQAGDTKAHTEVKDRITFSMVGLVVMIAAFILSAIVGSIVFGDPTFILKPELSGATDS